ncbi:PCNA-interacting partner [Engraulis encrasicolus]|uniref:PCNA-interacting partner n=1 Tax=Engraulis encrasicolus TaxID=184585 RepID=UPI002FD1E8DA
MANVEENLKKMVRIFRRECHRVLESERTTIRGPDEMLIILQLTMAEINKQETGEFGVALSDVLLCWRCLLLDRLQLPSEGCRRPDNYEPIRREYEDFLKRTNTMDLIDVYLMTKQLSAEELLTPEQLLHFISGGVSEEDPVESTQAPPCPSTPSSQPRPCTAQMRRVVRRVLCSYLCLLLNSKDDLALAVSMDTPSRALGRTAFTDLKHAARSGHTSLFLAVTSFVRAIQLGGKGYAPPEDHPLRRHLKGLAEFVTFTDNLEEILGDTPDPSVACGKLLSRMRSALLKGRSSGEQIYGAVEETTAALREQISLLHTRRREEDTLTTGISPARPKAYAINHATAYMGRATVKLLLELLDQEALAPPCRNKAELLTEDQAALNGEEGHALVMLYRSPEVVTGESPKPLRSRVQAAQTKDKVKRGAGLRSQFACTYVEEAESGDGKGDGCHGDDDLPLNRVLDFPSTSQLPTCKHPAPKRNTHTTGTTGTLHPHTDPEEQEQEQPINKA